MKKFLIHPTLLIFCITLTLSPPAYASGSVLVLYDIAIEGIFMLASALIIMLKKGTFRQKLFSIFAVSVEFCIFSFIWQLPGKYYWEYPFLKTGLSSFVAVSTLFLVLLIHRKK